MTHYEERLEQDVQRIRRRVIEAARYAERAFANAVEAMVEDDDDTAFAIMLGDHPLNREIHELDALCHAFIARHLPSAGHLRFVSSVLRMNIAIERIGDYAVTIARESVQLSQRPSEELRRDLAMMAEQSRAVLDQATRAFAEGNAELARGTMAMAGQVDASFGNVFSDLIEAGEEDGQPLTDLFALLITLNRIERVSDQAKNLCEEVLFAETGEVKEPKVYAIAFVDERNDTLSIIAQEIARKAYPDSGEYFSAGWEPAESLASGFQAFMDRQGHATDETRPAPLASLPSLSKLHLVVGVGEDPRPHLPALPYGTILQSWDVEPVPEGLDRERTDAVLRERYKELAARIEDLMETLHGEDAR